MEYIAYYRVSTTKQGESGLGLDAQRSAVLKYLNGKIPVAEYTDVESGTRKGNNRPNLKQAIKHAQEIKVTLIIAKLDRLARNINFISSLMESGIKFKACDMPEANEFTIHIFAALAEQEAKLISQRTKAALAELKEKGVKLGSPQNLNIMAREKGLAVRVNNAKSNSNNVKATALIESLRHQGISFYEIANRLNQLGFRTRRGREFTTTQAIRLYDRSIINSSN